MKKIIALLLALIMVMGLATVASAEGFVDTTDWVSAEKTAEVSLYKIYTVNGQKVVSGEDQGEDVALGNLMPNETLSFVSTPADANPDFDEAYTTPELKRANMDNLTIATIDDSAITEGEIGDDKYMVGTMTITLPVYEEVGVYNYTITETAGNAQGADYSKDSIGVRVYVTYDYEAEGGALATQVVLTTVNADGTEVDSKEYTGEDGNVWKLDTFENTYDLGHLSVTKKIEGNLADSTVEFKMTVEFTTTDPVKSTITIVDGSQDQLGGDTQITEGMWENNKATATIYVRADETVNFYNIPAGVTYKVVEDSQHHGTDAVGDDTDAGYEVDYDKENGTIEKAATAAATVTNTKETTVETGIVMDSVPFVVMAVIAVLGLAAFTAKKRVQE